MPHQTHLGNSSSNITFNISDNHGKQIYFFLRFCPTLPLHIEFGYKKKSNYCYKFTTQFFSFNKESYKIIRNKKKDMTVVNNPWMGTITSPKMGLSTPGFLCYCKWPFCSKLIHNTSYIAAIFSWSVNSCDSPVVPSLCAYWLPTMSSTRQEKTI